MCIRDRDALKKCNDSITTALGALEDRSTSILKAAFHALDLGLFTIPKSEGKWNPGQCIGFLLHAYQLQLKYNDTEDSTVPLEDNETQGSKESPDAPKAAHDVRFACIFTGAAGTGKTALLEACDMLTQAVYKDSACVYRSAPSRTAARLNRGNTCHSAGSCLLDAPLEKKGVSPTKLWRGFGKCFVECMKLASMKSPC